jgi:hypothetical protein
LLGEGQFVLVGPATFVQQAGKQIAAALEGKGGGKGSFQGKFPNTKNRHKVAPLLQSLLSAEQPLQ